jgi:hypothetical protein
MIIVFSDACSFNKGGGFFANVCALDLMSSKTTALTIRISQSPQGFPLYDWVSQHPNGLVAVSIAYRLGPLGFLASSILKADGDLNAGLLDQRAGLEWVQRHISAFGGDPEKVTIYGESAGGASVVMQITAYGGK